MSVSSYARSVARGASISQRIFCVLDNAEVIVVDDAARISVGS